ncbi:MAG: glutamine--tRNA ligase [unclassified Hahellaceae]|nr:glutamine--tRNA ligase [Hahellaceae bacterium]|tara:strand:+ start:4495 stop:6288 length:1794 start_codon:yes stop_codon:yes gene_type:complete
MADSSASGTPTGAADSESNTEKRHADVHNFILARVDKALSEGLDPSALRTRFPPEPNGFLHLGHAKSICLNYSVAERGDGAAMNLRFDDTNPEKEEQTYIDAIREDVLWLLNEDGKAKQLADLPSFGVERFASSYFEEIYQAARQLINKGLAFVCSLTPEEMTQTRGTLTSPGQNSPYRDRSVEENVKLFEAMRNGEFEDGQHTLRAKIDMASPNINMRDPILYRIRRTEHHQTGAIWPIFPMYDFTHPISDALEGISHSLCTLEFEDHRPLYDWVMREVDFATLGAPDVPALPVQIEFARLNLNYTVLSKRKLKRLVDENIVNGWADPRMPTIAGMRARGFTAKALNHFCRMIGVTRSDAVVDVSTLEFAVREDLNERAPRAMCVQDPLKVIITNYPEGQTETLDAARHPQNPDFGTRTVPFSREIYIEADDFREEANKKFKRLVLGKEVRLRNAYVIRCVDCVKDAAGKITELHCEYDDKTLGRDPEDRKVKGVIHWVSAAHAVPLTLHLYDRLFSEPLPEANKDVDFLEGLNPNSLQIVEGALGEASLAQDGGGFPLQFERTGYFIAAGPQAPGVYYRTVALRDTWAGGADDNG